MRGQEGDAHGAEGDAHGAEDGTDGGTGQGAQGEAADEGAGDVAVTGPDKAQDLDDLRIGGKGGVGGKGDHRGHGSADQGDGQVTEQAQAAGSLGHRTPPAQVVVQHGTGGLGGQALAQAFGVIAFGAFGHGDQLRQRQVVQRQVGAEPRLQQFALFLGGQGGGAGDAGGGFQDIEHGLGLQGHLVSGGRYADGGGAVQGVGPTGGKAA